MIGNNLMQQGQMGLLRESLGKRRALTHPPPPPL